jgi:hypothetical protein
VKILVIEDQVKRFHTVLKRLTDILEETEVKFKTKIIDNPIDAMEYFEKFKEQISLVILDMRIQRDIKSKDNVIKFDRDTGVYLYHKIKRIKKNQPVLFWTVVSKSEIEEEGVNIDDDYYCQKSSDYMTFSQKIDFILGTNCIELLEQMLSEG